MTVLAIAPALPLQAAGKYVAGAYIVFVLMILVYVTIMAIRLGRTERALVELNRDLEQRDAGAEASPEAHAPVQARERVHASGPAKDSSP